MQKTASSAWVKKAGTFLAFGSLFGQSTPALANGWTSPASFSPNLVSSHTPAHLAATSAATSHLFPPLTHSQGTSLSVGAQSTAALLSAQNQAHVLTSLSHHASANLGSTSPKSTWQNQHAQNMTAFNTLSGTGSLFSSSLPTGVSGPGLQLDLTSTSANIVLGSSLFNGAPSVTIAVGGKAVTLNPGSNVTPAEYIAIRQVLAGGTQTLTINGVGAATAGSFRLDAAAGAQVGEIVVPKNVVALDFANSASNPVVTGDIVNYGTIYGLTSRGSSANVSLNAQDILNERGATITTNLSAAMVRALGGALVGSSLSLTAGDTIDNAGTISSRGNILLSSGSGNISNSGLIASSAGNIDITSANAGSAITVNAAGGTFSALKGDINVRDASYNGSANVSLAGGDYLSHNLNIYSGTGTIEGNVGQLTGTVNTVAGVDHLQAATSNLVLGNNTVSGDPTFVNTSGSIVINGENDFNESVAIIASGDITANASGQIKTTGPSGQNNITLVAGALILPPSGNNTTTGTVGGSSGGGATNQAVTVDVTTAGSNGLTGSSTGGSVNLSGSNVVNVLDTSSTTGSAGNITLIAFSGAVNTAASSVLNAQSSAGNGGNVTIIAASGINVGGVTTGGSANGGQGGAISMASAQPTSSDGKSVGFATNGSINSGNTFSANPMDQSSLATITVNGDLNTSSTGQSASGGGTNGASAGAITVLAGGSVVTQNLLAYGSGGAGGDTIAHNGGAGGNGANITVGSINGTIQVNGDINASGGGGGGAGGTASTGGSGGAGGSAGSINVAVIPLSTTVDGSAFNINLGGNVYASAGGAGSNSGPGTAGVGGASYGGGGGGGNSVTALNVPVIADNGSSTGVANTAGGNVLISSPAFIYGATGNGTVTIKGALTGGTVEVDSPFGLTLNGNVAASNSLTITASVGEVKQATSGLNIDTPSLTIESTSTGSQFVSGIGFQTVPLSTDASTVTITGVNASHTNIPGTIADVNLSDSAANLVLNTNLLSSSAKIFIAAMTSPGANLTIQGSLPTSLTTLTLTTDSSASGGTLTLPSNTSITTGPGGAVILQANNIVAPGTLSINADSNSSTGGTISITTNNLNNNPDFTLGNAAGQLSLSARGINSSTSIGGAGSITLIAPNSNVTLAGTGIDVSYENISTPPPAQAFSGNGGSITLNVGSLLSASSIALNADGYGSGNGGKIAMTINSSTTQNIGTDAGQLSFSAKNGSAVNSSNAFGGSVSLTTAGALVVDSTNFGTATVAQSNDGGVNGGTLSLSASQITSSDGNVLNITNNGFNAGFGGKINITETAAVDAKLGNLSTDSFYLVAQGGGNASANGAVSVTTGGNIYLTTDVAGNVIGQGDSVVVGAAGANGGGGSLSLSGNTIQNMAGKSSGLIFNAAGVDTGFGGTIKLTVGDTQSINIGTDLSKGQFQFNVANGSSGVVAGSVSVNIGSLNDTTGTGVLTVDPAAIVEQVVSKTNANINGGSLQLVAPTILAASTVSSKTALILNASGAGKASGGSITYAETAPNSVVNIGTKPGQVELLAAAGKSGGSGGIVTAVSGGNLNVTVAGLSVKASGATGAGGRISLGATNANNDLNYGNLVVIGSLSANAGSAKAQGGTINLSSNSSDAFNIGLTKNNLNGVEGGLSASGISSTSGQGGNIVVTTSGSGGIVVQKSLTAAQFFQFNYANGATGNFLLNATVGSTKTAQILIAPTDNYTGVASNIIASKAGKLIVAMAAAGLTSAGNILLQATGTISEQTVTKTGTTTGSLNIVTPEISATTTSGDININAAIPAKDLLTIDTLSAGNNLTITSAGSLTTAGFTGGVAPLTTQGNEKLLATPQAAAGASAGGGSMSAGGDLSIDANGTISGQVNKAMQVSFSDLAHIAKLNIFFDPNVRVFQKSKPDNFIDLSGFISPDPGPGNSPQLLRTGATPDAQTAPPAVASAFTIGGNGAGNLSIDCDHSIYVSGPGVSGLTSFAVSTSAAGGTITGPGVLEAKTISVQTNGGDIGTPAAPIQINATNFSVNTGFNTGSLTGNAYINSLSTATVNATASNAGGYNLTAAAGAKVTGITAGDGGINITAGKTLVVDTLASSGPVTILGGSTTTVGSITTTGITGNIDLETSTGVLQTSVNAKVQAVNADITFENLNTTKGSILIAAGSNIETGDGNTGIGGDITFTIGPAPTPPVAGTAPAKNVTVTADTGTVYSGLNGITANASKGIGNTLDAKGVDIIFNTGNLKATAIKLNGNTTITADPPGAGSSSGQTSQGSQIIQANSQAAIGSPSDLDVSKSDTITPQTRTMSQAYQPLAGGVTMSAKIADQSPNTSQSVLNTQSVQINSNIGAAPHADTDARWISESEIESGLIPANFITDGKFTVPSEVSSVLDYAPSTSELKRGSAVFAPHHDTIVTTPFGPLKIAAKSVVLVLCLQDSLAVYNFDDSHKGSVSMAIGGENITLAPGKHLMISGRKARAFEEVNAAQAFAFRSVRSRTTQNAGRNLQIFTADFNHCQAISAVMPLRKLIKADNDKAKQLGERLLKTSAILAQLSASSEPYRQMPRPSVIASR